MGGGGTSYASTGGGGRRGARERRRIEGRGEHEKKGGQRDNDDSSIGRGTETEEEREEEDVEERGGFALQLADGPHNLAATDRSSLPSSSYLSRSGRRGGRIRFWGTSDGDGGEERSGAVRACCRRD